MLLNPDVARVVSSLLAQVDDDPLQVQGLPFAPVAPGTRLVRVTRAHASALMAMCDRHAAEIAHARMPPTTSHGSVLELMEALFEPPLRAWAWLAEDDGQPAGYLFATVGFSMIERAYYFNVEALFVPASRRPSGVASALLTQARRMAAELGCVDVRWQLPVWQQAERIALPGHGDAAAVAMVQYVFPTMGGDADVH